MKIRLATVLQLLVAQFLLVSLAICQVESTSTRDNLQTDADALAVISRCLQSSGLSKSTVLTDLTANGEVHHYWAGKDVQGTAALYSRTPDQFRFDSATPNGKQSFIVDGPNAQLRTISGQLVTLSSANFLISKNPIAPFLEMATALADGSSVFRYVDSVVTASGQADRVLLTKTNTDAPRVETTSKLYYIDRRTSRVVETDEMLDSTTANQDKLVRKLIYAGFGTFQGITLATQITEEIKGQKTWDLHLTSIGVNSGISSDVFKF